MAPRLATPFLCFARGGPRTIPPESRIRCGFRSLGGAVGELSPSGREQLQMLGRTLAFDILIHNYDRLRCLWGRDGEACTASPHTRRCG